MQAPVSVKLLDVNYFIISDGFLCKQHFNVIVGHGEELFCCLKQQVMQ